MWIYNPLTLSVITSYIPVLTVQLQCHELPESELLQSRAVQASAPADEVGGGEGGGKGVAQYLLPVTGPYGSTPQPFHQRQS